MITNHLLETQDWELSLTESDDSVVTYSVVHPIALTRLCRNECPYCSFNRKDNLVVPYSTIRLAKHAKSLGIKELALVAGERPDKYNHIRSLLDLWGFESYADYLYTVCELGFLEGLIPTIEFGFLSPQEMKQIRDVIAVSKIMLDSVDDHHVDKVYPNSPGKKRDIRLKLIEWASKLKIPVSTGIMIGIGETKTHRKECLQDIAALHQSFGMIHDVVIQPLVPQSGTKMTQLSKTAKQDLLTTFEMAKSILPDDITLTVPVDVCEDSIPELLSLGLRDLGRLYHPEPISYGAPSGTPSILSMVQEHGLTLQPRLPLKRSFIKNGLYSKKLGQVFDNYRYKMKKESADKLKEPRIASHPH